MLSAVEVQEINQQLGSGDVAAAVARIEKEVDLRAKDQPQLEKATIKALSSRLKNDSEAARILGEGALHPNVSVRRFVRKLGQSLKNDGSPLAKPLRARLERYIDETVALDYSQNPKEAALRREQADVLDTSIELLRRLDLEEFLDTIGDLIVRWQEIDEAQQQAEAPARQAAEERGTKIMKAWRVHEEFVNAVFQERYAQLGVPLHEFQQTSPRLWEELMQTIQANPEYQAVHAEAEAAAAAAAPEMPEQPAGKTLAEDYGNVNRSFREALSGIHHWQDDKAPREQQVVQTRMWKWLEAGLMNDDLTGRRRALGISNINGWHFLGPRWMQQNALPLLQKAKGAGRDNGDVWNRFVYALHFVFYRDTAGQTATPVPEHVTPEAIRALKNGGKQEDEILERLAVETQKRLEKQEKQTAKAAVAAETGAVEEDEDEEDDSPWAHLLKPDEDELEVAARYTTIDERLQAICDPPVIEIEDFVGKRTGPMERTDLLDCWREEAGWKAREPELAKKAVPRLLEKMRQSVEEYREVHNRKKPAHFQITPEMEAKLNKAEREKLEEQELGKEQFAAEMATDDLIYAIRELGGMPAVMQALEMLEHDELQGYQGRHVRGIISMLGDEKQYSGTDVDTSRKLVKLWERAELKSKKSEDDIKWFEQSRDQFMAGVLYRSDDPAHQDEALDLVRARGAYDSSLPKVARQRGDTRMLVPLVRALLPFYDNHNDDLLEMWKDLIAQQSPDLQEVLPELLESYAGTTDAKQLRMPQEMLEAVDKKSPLWNRQQELLTRCVESPLPAVSRFALERLGAADIENADWESLCGLAAEKLFSENAGLAREAAKFLGQIGAAHKEVTETAAAALGDALSLQNLPLLETCLKSLQQVKDKQRFTWDDSLRERIEELGREQKARLGKLCDKLLA